MPKADVCYCHHVTKSLYGFFAEIVAVVLVELRLQSQMQSCCLEV